MKKQLVETILSLRAIWNRWYRPASRYFLYPASDRKLEPIGAKTGFDRGAPIDRYYIENFLSSQKNLVRGRCLEIHDTTYIARFGEDRVVRAEALDINRLNPQADIIGDLRNLKGVIGDSSYDCLIITQTLGMIDDLLAAVGECHRILKPGGVLLITSSAMAPCFDEKNSYWRFTKAGMRWLLEKFFLPDKITIESYGNVLAGQAFWTGMAQEDLQPDQLLFNDERFPIIIAGAAIK